MLDLKNEVKNVELENAEKMNELIKILDKQEFPCELNQYLGLMDKESRRYGWPLVAIRAYCFGVIMGKRNERNKKLVKG